MATASVIVPARTPRPPSRGPSRRWPSRTSQALRGDRRRRRLERPHRGAGRAAPGPVTVLRQPPRGPAAARNLGVEPRAGGCWRSATPTCSPPPAGWRPGWLRWSPPTWCRAACCPTPVALGPFDRTLWIQFEVGLWETANLFATREVFDRAGGFEEWLEPEIGKAMAEDVWFGWKARRAGARTAFAADALAHHAVFPRDWRAYVASAGGCATSRRWRPRCRSCAATSSTAGSSSTAAPRRSTRRGGSRRRGAAALACPAGGRRALRGRGGRRAGRTGARSWSVAARTWPPTVGMAALVRGSVRYRSPLL